MSSPSRPNIDSLDRDQQLQQDPSSKNYALSGKIMLSSIIILFVVVIFLVLLHLYARWYLLRLRRRNETRRTNRRTRIVFYADANNPSPAPTRGLDACVLKRLPLFIYSSEKHGDVTECAVCLSEFEEGETGRVLPKCKHSFHIECIDMWFCSHSTCPLCRSPVEPGELELTMPECLPQPGSSNSGTDTYHVETTSLADRRKGIDVRIDVPSRSELAGETELRLVSPSQGFRSPGSRLLALKRIISMSRKSPVASPSSGVGPSFLSVTESDVESGVESTRIGTDEHR